MKTKFWPSFVAFGIVLASGIGTRTITSDYDPVQAFVNLIIFVLAVLFVGYGLKLRRLKKKGIEDTKDKNYLVEVLKEKNKPRYCGWSIAALIFAFMGGWIGIILGIIALYKIKKNPNLSGKGIAITAIIISLPMMFFWLFIPNFFYYLDPIALLPEESQMRIYCEDICLEEQNLQNSYVEINPGNQSEYLCSCLDSEDYIIAQYAVLVGFSQT